MGTSFQSCTCIKSGEEEKTEFKPKIPNGNNMTKLAKSTPMKIKTPSKNLFQQEEVLILQTKLFIFLTSRYQQCLTRAFLFRKKFYEKDGIKVKLTNDSEDIIKKDNEFIVNTLLETDKMIKKDLYGDFLVKL